MSQKVKAKKDRNKPGRDRPRTRRTPPQIAALLGAAENEEAPALPDGFEVAEYDIVYEAMPSEEELKLPPADQERLHQAGMWSQSEELPEHIADFEKLVEEFPDFPSLYNYLYAAYRYDGRHEDADRLLDRTCARFPDYLFGMTSKAEMCLRDGRAEEVPGIFRECLSLDKLYPGRRRFHLTEFLGFHGILAWYFHEIGDEEAAQRYLRLMEDVEPDHHTTRRIRAMMNDGNLMRMALWVLKNPGKLLRAR